MIVGIEDGSLVFNKVPSDLAILEQCPIVRKNKLLV